MEQYFMPAELDFKHLRFCLKYYSPDWLYIRLKGASGGDVKVNETLEGKKLTFKKKESGLYFLIDREEIFHFPMKNRQKGFSLAYERVGTTGNEKGRILTLSYGIDPYDTRLPEPQRSFLRHVMDDHLLEIFFKNRIHIKFHSWWNKPDDKYWTIIKPPVISAS